MQALKIINKIINNNYKASSGENEKKEKIKWARVRERKKETVHFVCIDYEGYIIIQKVERVVVFFLFKKFCFHTVFFSNNFKLL